MRRHVAMICAFLVCATAISGATPTRAGGTSLPGAAKGTSPTGETGEKQHCVYRPQHTLECFGTEAEALYAASDGRIKLPMGGNARSVPDEELFGATSTIQAILYKDANESGASLSIVGECSGWNNLSTIWNDVVSSVRTDDCGVTLYENTNLGGTSLSISPPGTSYVGSAMNDKASSWSLP